MKFNCSHESESDRGPSIGKLIWIIHRHHSVYLDNKLRELGIGVGQFRFLMQINRHDGLNQEQLSCHLDIDKTTTARALAKLEKEGLIYREKDPDDHRAHLLHITSKGRKVIPELKNILMEGTEILIQDFTGEEKELLISLLSRMLKNMGCRKEHCIGGQHEK